MKWRIAVEGEETTAVFEPATEAGGKALFVAAHGAGSHMDHRSMLQLSEVLRERGGAQVGGLLAEVELLQHGRGRGSPAEA